MKKNVLNKMEKINEERKLSKEAKKSIRDRVIANASVCISLAILIFTIKIISKFLSKGLSLTITNISSLIFLMFTITIFEIAYKKDSGKLAITGIELLFISIFVLFSQYINLKINSKVINMILVIFSIYYITKIIVIYYKGKNAYLKGISDINNIIKRESKDKLVEEFKIKEEEKTIKEKKKTARTNKVKTTTKSAKTQTQKKKTSTSKTRKSATTKKTTNKKTKNEEK